MSNQLNATLKKYLSERAKLATKKRSIDAKLATLDLQITTLKEAGAVEGGDTSIFDPFEQLRQLSKTIKTPPPPPPTNDSNKNWGQLTNSIVQVIERADAPLTPVQVKEAVLALGFKPGGNPARFPIVVNKTLARLRDKRIRGELKNGTWHYSPLQLEM